MEIESFEPYHIGIKLRPPIDPAIITKLISTLQKMDFETIQQAPYGIPLIEIARKKNTVVQINLDANAVNAIGINPNDVMSIHEELIKSFDAINIDLESSVSFYELISVISIKTHQNPQKVLENNIKFDLSLFSKYDASISGIKISKSKIENENELFEIYTEPKSLSPRERYYMRIFLKSSNFDEIKDLNDNIKEFVEEYIQNLEANVDGSTNN